MMSKIDLPRSTPESQGISSTAILDFITALEKNIQHIHSIMLLRHGSVVAEGWWHPYQSDTPHMLFSLSKSFTSTAVGLAIAEGRLSVEDRVLSFFPEDAPKKISQNLSEMKVKHLLSMSTGHDQDSTERTMRSRNPFKGFLSMPVKHIPGTHFVYNSGASYMLAAIVQKLTGETLLDYLTPRLFEPLGIIGATWETHANGVNFGGWGLKIKTEDIARFGQLYLQKGLWNGKRILSEDWVAAATSEQVSNGDVPDSDWSQGYGYQFWRCRYNIYRGDGAFGQYCIVMPDQDAVLAITAGVPDMQAVLNIIWDRLLPEMEKKPLIVSETVPTKLVDVLKNLEIVPREGASSSRLAAQVSGKTFTFGTKNYEALKSIRFDFGKSACTLIYTLLGGGERHGKHQLTCGYGTWQKGTVVLASTSPQPVTASGVWTAKDTFVLTLCYTETPFISTITCKFAGEKLFYQSKANVSFGPPEQPQLVGVAEPIS
jgi:CubicO group peptidase (beta-lactamase class C family)